MAESASKKRKSTKKKVAPKWLHLAQLVRAALKGMSKEERANFFNFISWEDKDGEKS
jgi:hypothetical protein